MARSSTPTGSSTSSHYFLKLFRNDTADSLSLTGMGFYARTSHPESNVFQAAGAIVMGSDLVGVRRLLIPPALGYGSRSIGNGVIPRNSTLLFEIELLAVESVTLAPQSQ